MPRYLPAHRELVYASGVAEVAGGLGVLAPRTRRLGAWWLIATLVAVFPANVEMAVHAERFKQFPEPLLWARLPLQGALIAWVYKIAKKSRRGPACPAENVSERPPGSHPLTSQSRWRRPTGCAAPTRSSSATSSTSLSTCARRRWSRASRGRSAVRGREPMAGARTRRRRLPRTRGRPGRRSQRRAPARAVRARRARRELLVLRGRRHRPGDRRRRARTSATRRCAGFAARSRSSAGSPKPRRCSPGSPPRT